MSNDYSFHSFPVHMLHDKKNPLFENLTNYDGHEENTLSFKSRMDTLSEALAHLAYLIKTPVDVPQKQASIKQYVHPNPHYFSDPYYYAQDRLLSMLGTFGHPSRHFEWRELVILRTDILQQIEEFRNRHYSANRMSLCLKTHLSLDDMQVRDGLKKLHDLE